MKIFEPFVLIHASAERRAHLLDVSETGALVHCDLACCDGERVTLRVGGQSLAARIAWVKPPRFGVVFVEPLTASLLQSLMAR